MSDIKKGYTFTDKSTDWVSNKETAIRLNKMLDDAKLNLVAGTNITITPTANGPSIAATGAGTGTVTSVNLTAGTGISVSGGPITTSGSITVNNTAPDQVVSLTGTGTTTVTGTYPSFTINSADQHVGTVTAVTGTLPILSSGGTAPDISINAATTLLPGSMSAADKTKLDGIEAGAQVNVATNLAQGTRTTTTVPVTSSTGNPATLDVATTLLAGVMSSADKAKLDGIAANANNYSLPKATSTVLGGVELFDDTVQTVASNAVTTTSARTYGVQLNSVDQMVVNVPWIDSTFAAQTEKTFFAGPASSPSATPTFRAIASTDLPAFGSGDVAFAVGGGAGTIASNVIYNANINSGAAIDYSKLAALNSTNILVGSSANVATSTAVTGDVTISNTGVTTIGADKVTNSQLANMGATTVKVNATTSTADPTDLLVSTNTVVGRVAGDIVAAQVVTDQIADNAVTFAKLQDGVANTVLARAAATNGDVAGVALAASQLLGRGPAGDITAISLGSNLSITGTTLDSTGSGGGIADGATLTTGLTFPVSGLHILDTDASHDLIISPGGDLTADRTLTITTGNANRTVTLTGDTSLIGTNTGDQTITLTGGVTGSGTGSFAATVVTNANLTGPITSVGNATSVAAQTGTGSTFVMQASPTLTTPALGTPTSGLLNSCTSNINATGNVARTFQARAGDVFNVKDFGATGDGSTNDLPAFNAAATAMLAYGGGCIYMPAPSVSYKLAGVWTITQTANSQSICLRGDGAGVTKLFFSAASNGIEIIASVAQTEGATTSNVITVEDFSICASQAGVYKGLKISGENVNGSSIGYEIRRISFEGYTVTKYWKDAIHLINCPNAVIKSVRTVSANNSIANGGDAIFLDSTAPDVNRSPTVCDISNVNVQGHAYGIRVIGSNSWEGVTVSECTFVLVNTGIYWNTTTVEEQLNVTNCHIKAVSSWINVNNCNRCFITSGNFDKEGSAAFTGIDINANSDWATITNNFLRCGSGDVAVSMDSSNHTIVGNKMEGQSSGIVLNSGSDRSLVALNQLYNSGGTARAGTCVTDNGANNQVLNNF